MEMNIYHSTISRRNFMKGLGLSGAALGAATASAPVFHDLDEMITSVPKSTTQHAWWVKERDYEDITTPVDWTVWSRREALKNPMPPGFAGNYVPKEQARLQSFRDEIKRGITEKIPGATLRDWALSEAGRSNTTSSSWMGLDVKPPWLWGEASALPVEPWPEGAPKWESTPEDNLRTVQAAGHYFGTPQVGAMEINEHMIRMFDKDGFEHNYSESYEKPMMRFRSEWFEDIPVGFQDANQVKHIPKSCKWAVTYIAAKENALQMTYGMRTGDPQDPWYKRIFPLGYTTGEAYSKADYVKVQFMKFIKMLGYQTYYMGLAGGTSSNSPAGVFSGLAEEARPALACSPYYGNAVRHIGIIVTDMPLSPTKPIDAGIVNFCKVCKKCAETCPSGAISMETEQQWEPACTGNNPGRKTWYLDWFKCRPWGSPYYCPNCQTVCPFNNPNKAIIHNAVRMTAATTPIFNSFFSSLDKSFGYAHQRSDEERLNWWYRDLNTWQYDDVFGMGTKDPKSWL
ncbi:reductive dehalogenase [Dehalococcoides mccartyi]|uniref:Reductive dehalogenase n=1 Tax=Dehalococcoides mccartyi (strain VS) TaxID=311424 RepID=D2BG11_DEHMV|nr:reductive dehalogenase [Dehalococcoides mccartyi]ACZ61261.1 reductive dehalogenase [Dehalococcoides mccartyi VS]